jgi:hypothetical protein
MVLGWTQPLSEMSTRNLSGGKGQPERKADNLTAICDPAVQIMWEPCPVYGPPRPVTGIDLPFFLKISVCSSTYIQPVNLCVDAYNRRRGRGGGDYLR